jgi:hypothetical protein
MVDKAIVIENKIKQMDKDGKRKVPCMDNPLEATLGLAGKRKVPCMDNPPKATLGLASHSLTSFPSHHR